MQRKRSLLNSYGPDTGVSCGTRAASAAQRAEHAVADTAHTPPAAAPAAAAAAQPDLGGDRQAVADATCKQLEELASEGRPYGVQLGEQSAVEHAVHAAAQLTQHAQPAAGQPATAQQHQEERRGQGAEEAPVTPPPALAGLAFGAAWLAVRKDLKACGAEAAAQARAAELSRLLTPVAQRSACAARAVRHFTCCFCSVLEPHQQVQHLQQLQAELAGGGLAAVQAWVEFTLKVLSLPAAD